MFFLCLLTSVCVQAQQMVVRPFPFMNELYSNDVTDLLPSDDGFLWIGTAKGLSMWDGYFLHSLRSDYRQPHLLSHNSIRYLSETSSTVWIATQSGMTLYDKKHGAFRQMNDERIAANPICGLAILQNENVWIAVGHRVFRCTHDGEVQEELNPFAEAGINEEDFINIVADRKQNLWLLCRHNVLICYERQSGRFRQMPPVPNGHGAFTLCQDSGGRYWIGTWGGGLWQLFPKGDGPQGYYLHHPLKDTVKGEEVNIVFNLVQALCKPSDIELAQNGRGAAKGIQYGVEGLLWALTYNGLFALNYQDGKLQPMNLKGVVDTQKMFTALKSDHLGNVWIGGRDMGYTIYFDQSGIKSDRLSWMNERLGWDANLLNLASEGRYVWMVQDRQGLLLYDRESKEHIQVTDIPSENIILRPAREKKHVWVGMSQSRRLALVSHNGMQVRTEQQLALRQQIGNVGRLADMAEDPTGNLWILTSSGLLVRPADKESLMMTRQAGDSAQAIALGRSGEVWCMAGNDLLRCECRGDAVDVVRTGRFSRYMPDEHATHLLLDDSDALWMVTSWGRLFRSDKQHQHFEALQLDSLLSNSPILHIETTQGHVWLMTNRRVLCFNLQEGTTQVFSAAQGGIGVQRFLQHALCREENGSVLAGGQGGFVHLPLLSADTVPVRVRIADVLVGEQSLFFGTANGQTFDHITLSPDARNISIHFTTIPIPHSEVHIQYRLKGNDNDWRTADYTSPEAFYNRLPRGIYEMEVRICQPNGSWGEPVELLTIIRKPAWWETWWAFTLYGLLSLTAFLLLLWLNRRRHQQELHIEVAQAKMNILTTDDHKLLDQLVAIIVSHLDDSDFDLEQLASEMNMSKSTLHRRLKAAADMTPLDFIRSIRMKRASKMLLAGTKNISEVAYAVGFTTPKYFTKCFKEEFGVTPSDYIRKESSTSNNP